MNTTDIHRAIAQGLADELHPPAGAHHIHQYAACHDVCQTWYTVIRYHTRYAQYQCMIVLLPEYIQFQETRQYRHDITSRTTPYAYEDPQLIDRLQLALYRTG